MFSHVHARSSNPSDKVVDEDRLLSTNVIDDATWDSTASACIHCKERVPHSLLYVCRKKSCEFEYQPGKNEVNKPIDFYNNEKVFCAKCTFRGSHSPHSNWMQETLPLAMAAASNNGQIAEDFSKLAFINHEDLVDYHIVNELGVQQLEILPAVEYLLASEDVHDWVMRKAELDECRDNVINCRHEAHKMVKKLADNAMKAYESLMKTIKDDLGDDFEDKVEEEKEEKAEEELANSIEDKLRGHYTYPSSFGSLEELRSLRMEKEENEPEESGMETLESDQSMVKLLCGMLSSRFDQVRDSMTIEHALQDVSDQLVKCSGTDKDKLAAAKLFKERHNVALYYPPEPEEVQSDADA